MSVPLPKVGQRSAISAGGAADRAAAEVDVSLPKDATGSVHVVDRRSKVGVRVSLLDATHAPLTHQGGLASYRGAAPHGGDVFHRLTASGDEDFVRFVTPPPEETLRYRVELDGARGLRLFGGVLEVLDAKGVPRLRVPRPVVLDARGASRKGDLSVEGCAVDTSPLPAWTRVANGNAPIVGSAAASCTVVVRWQGAGAAYPIVVDPSWEATSSMLFARSFHAVAPLPNLKMPSSTASPVLITGGFDENGFTVAEAEIFEPLTQSFSTTSPLAHPRGAHTATTIPGTGQVLVAGGSTPAGSVAPLVPPEQFGSPTNSSEIYDETTGQFAEGPALQQARLFHTATALNDGRILLAGGTGASLPAAELVVPSGATGGYTTTPTSGGDMLTPRTAHAAALLETGAVLMTGGYDASGNVLAAAETFCPVNDCSFPITDGFRSATPMATARAFHTATTLYDGDVVVAGGITALTAPTYLASAELFHASKFEQGPDAGLSLTGPRAFHTATLLLPEFQLSLITNPGADAGPVLVSGTAQLLLAGGYNGTHDLVTAEAYLPATSTFGIPAAPSTTIADGGTTGPIPVTLAQARRHAAAIIVNAGQSVTAGNAVLVCGGAKGSASIATAEIFFKTDGDACQSDDECLSGHCAYGVCCDTACEGACYTCVGSAQQPAADGGAPPGDGTCSPTRFNTALGIACGPGPLNPNGPPNIEVHYICDGMGNEVAGADTRDCLPSVCVNNRCSNYCDNGANQCAANGWCDFSQPPDGGIEGAGGSGGSTTVGSTTSGSSGSGTGGASTSDGGLGGGGSSGATSSSSSSSSSSASSSGSSDGGTLMFGTCQFKGAAAQMAKCTADSHCLTPSGGTNDAGLCVDGYCCDSPCASQCQACDVSGFEGVCHTVSGPVHSSPLHPREACNGVVGGEVEACAGTCPGPGASAAVACTYPDGGVLDKPLDCVDNDAGTSIVRTEYPCNGDGSYTSVQSDCSGYRCLDAHACRTSCGADTDCAADFICVFASTSGTVGSCQQLVTSLCDGHVTLRRTLAQGGNLVCPNDYACPASAMACLTSCEAVQDCAPGYVCDDSHVCVSPLAPPSLPACSIREVPLPPTHGGDAEGWLAVAGLLVAASTRRRRAPA